LLTIFFVLNLIVTCQMNKKMSDISIELHYGTYPSESFPDDPRHRETKWYEICGKIE
jgi:hypothetical protein